MSDLISRKELIDSLNRFAPEHFHPLINDLIIKQPSAETTGELDDAIHRYVKSGHMKPIAPLGNWVFCEDTGYYECSECGTMAEIDSVTGDYRLSKYCGECGARMENWGDGKSE